MIQKKIIIGSAIISIIILLLSEPHFSFINHGYFREIESSLLAPTFFTVLSYFISSSVLLPFSNVIFKLWIQKIVVWFLPASVLLLLAASPTRDGVVSFTRTDYAIVLGVMLSTITIVFALVQKFHYKR